MLLKWNSLIILFEKVKQSATRNLQKWCRLDSMDSMLEVRIYFIDDNSPATPGDSITRHIKHAILNSSTVFPYWIYIYIDVANNHAQHHYYQVTNQHYQITTLKRISIREVVIQIEKQFLITQMLYLDHCVRRKKVLVQYETALLEEYHKKILI